MPPLWKSPSCTAISLCLRYLLLWHNPARGLLERIHFFFFLMQGGLINKHDNMTSLDSLRLSPVRHSCWRGCLWGQWLASEIRVVIKGHLIWPVPSGGKTASSPSWRLCPAYSFLPPEPFSQPNLGGCLCPCDERTDFSSAHFAPVV